ncbi:hypothetical protein EV714DRAFT_288170 [Schizophyllum commune]
MPPPPPSASDWVNELLQAHSEVLEACTLYSSWERLMQATDHVNLRTTRSGATFSGYYTVNNPGFDLDNLLAQHYQDGLEQDEEDLVGADIAGEEEGIASNASSPLSSPPSTPAVSRAPSPSPQPAKRQKNAPPSPCDRASNPTTPDRPQPNIETPLGNQRKAAKKRNSRKSRKQKAQRREREGNFAPPPAALLRNARHLAAADFVEVPLNWEKQPVTSTGFTGLRGERDDTEYSLEDLIGPKAKVEGFKLINWDGRQTCGLAAPDGRVFGVLAGQPDDEGWTAVHEELAEEISKGGARVKFPQESREHRRGTFGAEAQGTSHGGGQTAPGNLKHSPAMTSLLLHLIGLTAMIRVAHFASSVFFNWAPALWLFYADHMRKLFDNDPTLEQNFARSVWACITINFGPQTVCYRHRDFGNLSFGWCAITALGSFNPNRGGHLVLWECGLVIRFPPGSTILIPSAIITHSNTKIGRRETRYSVTQYTAGAIFRWVQHGCKLDEQFYASLSRGEARKARKDNAGRWAKGAALWSKVGELQAAAREVVETLGGAQK